MERQFAPNPPNDWDLEEGISDEIQDFISHPPTLQPELSSVEEVSERLSARRHRKALGSDGVTVAALQRLPERGIQFLVGLFNACLRQSYFPQKWRKATVILIPKPGKDPKQVGGLRPISLLSHTSKLLERLIQKRIQRHLQRLDVLIPEQFGFREGHCSTRQLMMLVECISGAGCAGNSTIAMFLDVEQAFDRVWHEGLLLKFRGIQIPDFYLHLIASFIWNRTFTVRVDSTLSQERHITAGVRQGSLLGLLLFSVYVNDVPKVPGVELSMFPDDTRQNAKYAAPRLQRQLNACVEWAEKWRVSINASKSTAVVFSKN